MKRIGAILIAVVLLCGCTGKSDELERVMTLRAKLLGCMEVRFDAAITADYGDEVHTFAMSCTGDNQGNLQFTVTQPESIAGITGSIGENAGALTFDDVALAFPLMADEQVTPVSGPWILLRTLLGGYLTACGMEGDKLRVSIDDSYEDDALQLEIWLNEDDLPVQAEIIYDGRRIVTMEIEHFEIV